MKLGLKSSVHEQYIIAPLLPAGIVAGLRFGILVIPSWAFDVPMHFLDDDAVPVSYYSVTNTHLFVSAILLLVTAYPVRDHAWDDGTGDVDELIPGHSDDDGDGRDSVHDLGGGSTSEFSPHPLDRGESA